MITRLDCCHFCANPLDHSRSFVPENYGQQVRQITIDDVQV